MHLGDWLPMMKKKQHSETRETMVRVDVNLAGGGRYFEDLSLKYYPDPTKDPTMKAGLRVDHM